MGGQLGTGQAKTLRQGGAGGKYAPYRTVKSARKRVNRRTCESYGEPLEHAGLLGRRLYCFGSRLPPWFDFGLAVVDVFGGLIKCRAMVVLGPQRRRSTPDLRKGPFQRGNIMWTLYVDT